MYTVSDSTTTIMLECGLPWRKIRELLNFRTSEVAGILITHKHGDHSKGIAEASKAGMDIYSHKATFEQLHLSGHRFNDIESGKQFPLGTMTILPFDTVHDCEGSLGFLIQDQEGDSFLFLTDSMYSPVKFPALNVIAVECNNMEEILSERILSGKSNVKLMQRIRHAHMSLETLIKLLKANDLSRCRGIYLLHLSNANSDEKRMIQTVQEATGIPCWACEA